jgi:ApaG protein
MSKSESTTHGVRVNVRSTYIPEKSSMAKSVFFFAYRVSITNVGESPVKLLSRHWVVTDANEKVEEIRGPGVVGEQPLLNQGEAFTYTSACILETPLGVMRGTYQMLNQGGSTFTAQIAPFTLAQKAALH